MLAERVLLFTDAVDSTRLTEQLGDVAASALWAEHDRVARQLLRDWRGIEIDKSDGFLLLFECVDDAVAYASALHEALARLEPPVRCRAGVHLAPMVLRNTTEADRALGAKAVELDGAGKAVASRIMALAQGGQTLLSEPANAAFQSPAWQRRQLGHYRLKGMAEPVALWEVVAAFHTPWGPPADGPKAYRVSMLDGAWHPVAELRHGLPAERDGFIGRSEALAALAARFDDEARLVTVLGIGGMGKTRLALRYARQWLGDYPGGAWFSDLSAARSLDGIVHAVAQSLDVPLGPADPVQQLGQAIGGRGECLLILDNFEQVVGHAEATVGVWLERAPQARFLVTSRESLGVAGEQVLPLAPMAEHEAVKLFERRARAADGHGIREAQEIAALPRLVQLLDGLPLAIELAAARVPVMKPRAMLLRIGERFSLLAAKGRRHDRQATLRAALDWSWDLLNPVEQAVAAQLAVFEAGFTLDAAEQVAELPTGSGGGWIGDVVQSLVHKSLLVADGERLGYLRTVHEYMRLQLAAPGVVSHPLQRAAEARHVAYFARLEAPSLASSSLRELENLLAAFGRAVDLQMTAPAVALLVMCIDALLMQGPMRAIPALVDKLSAAVELSPTQHAVVSRAVGHAHFVLGNTEQALQTLERGLAWAAAERDAALLVRLLCALVEVHGRRGDAAKEDEALARALALAKPLADEQLAYTLGNRHGLWLLDRGRAEEAKAVFEQALAQARSLSHTRWVGGILGHLGHAAYALGELQLAAAHFEEAAALSEAAGDRQWALNARCNLAFVQLDLAQLPQAEQQFRELIHAAQEIGHASLVSTARCNLGLALLAREQWAAACEAFEAAARVALETGDHRLHAECEQHLAEVRKRLEQAAASA